MANQPQQNPPKQQGFGNLFGGHPKNGNDSEEIKKIRHDLNSLSRRLREIEERNQNLRRKTQMTDQNLMNQNRKYMQELKVVNSELSELKHIMNDLDNKMILLIKELRMCARNEDVKVLEKYVSVWEPIRFVTRNEVEKIIKHILNDVSEDIIKKNIDEALKSKMESFK